MWFLATILAALSVRILVPQWRRRPPGSTGRALTTEFGVRPSAPDGRFTRAERLRASALAFGTAAGLAALTILSFVVMERWPNGSTPNMILGFFGFMAAFLACLAIAAMFLHLVGAFVARAAGRDAMS